MFVNGRLNFSQWENDEGEKRSKLEVVANTVEGEFQFRKSGEKPVRADAQTTTELPADGTPAPAGEDDIPF